MIINNYIEVLKKYTVFDGRAGRPEFWWFQLVHFAISIALAILVATTSDILGILQGIYGLGVLLPVLGVGARRLHDTGRSGWFQLMLLVPIIGWIILIILCAQRGNQYENKYGPPPA